MKIIKIIVSVLFISLFNLTFSTAEDCSKYDKLSKEYAKCTSDKLKKKTSKKTKKERTEILHLFVDSKYRRKGLGLRLIKEIENHSVDSKIYKINTVLDRY